MPKVGRVSTFGFQLASPMIASFVLSREDLVCISARLGRSFLVVIVVGFTLGCEEPWSEYGAPADGFRAAFPEVPNVTTFTLKLPCGVVRLRRYVATRFSSVPLRGVVFFSVNSYSSEFPTPTENDPCLSDAVGFVLSERVLPRQTLRVTSDTIAALAGVPAREVRARIWDKNDEIPFCSIARIVRLPDRVIAAEIVRGIREPAAGDVARFFNSLELLSEPR